MTIERDELIAARAAAVIEADANQLTGSAWQLNVWKRMRELYAIEMAINPIEECTNCLGSGVVITPEEYGGYAEDNCDCNWID